MTGAGLQEPGCLQWVCLSLLSFGFPAAEQGGVQYRGGKWLGVHDRKWRWQRTLLCLGQAWAWEPVCSHGIVPPTYLIGFILREGEDTPPHVASISPSEWSSLPSPCSSQAPETLTTPGLCTQPMAVFTITSFFSLSYKPGEVSDLTACLKNLGQAHRHCYQSLLSVHTVTRWMPSLLGYRLLLSEEVSM